MLIKHAPGKRFINFDLVQVDIFSSYFYSGVKGTPGERGLDGLAGAKGDNGFNGADGLPGLKGEPGIAGNNELKKR